MNNLSSRILLSACALTFATIVVAEPTGSKSTYEATVKSAEADYEIDKATCDQLSGNPKDICMAKAKERESSAKAAAEASYKPSVDNIVDSRVTQADGAYKVAKEKCDAITGNAKDVCLKDAEANHTAAVAEAKADGEGVEAHIDANKKIRSAEYDAVKERCDAYSGDRKDACVAEAKERFGK